jgi:uncharacterized protein (TIGR02300 family)
MTLANTTLGEKRTCPECGAKFYDLGKRPCVCPKCKTTFDPVMAETAKPKRTREKPKAAPVTDEDVEDDEDEDDEDSAEGGDEDEDEDEDEEGEE